MARHGYKLLCLLAIIATTCGLPRINIEKSGSGHAMENVAFNILKAKLNNQDNLVFAPFGYASILAMLGEGARGETQQEIRKFLGLSDDNQLIRDTFRSMMVRYAGNEPSMVPQFKTWFYVYQNNSVNEDFVKTLRDDYLVEVKTIERNFYDFDETATVSESTPPSDSGRSEEIKSSVLVVDMKESATKGVDTFNENENQFDAVDIDGKNIAEDAEIDDIIKQKECSRFDETVDDHQYVEVHELRDKVNVADASQQPEDNETVHPIEKLDEKKVVKIDENAETLKRIDEDMGVLQEVKRHPVTKKFQAATARSLEEINDVSSALSGNSLTGPRTDGRGNGEQQQSKMLLFNGLYFRGKWKTPFQRLRAVAEPGATFYLEDEPEPIEVAMMRSRGEFKTGFSEAHKAKMIELPYENERYAMLVVMPTERDNGLRNLVDRLEDYSTIKQLSSNLKLRTVDLSLPKFNVETTSTVHKEFAEMGLATLFSDAADLSGITGEQRLRVDELVQHVSVRVDEGASTENSISAADAIPRTTAGKSEREVVTEEQDEDEIFIVDRPFLFFVRDTIDDVTLVSGLINRPRGPQLFPELLTQDRATAAKAEKEMASTSKATN